MTEIKLRWFVHSYSGWHLLPYVWVIRGCVNIGFLKWQITVKTGGSTADLE